MPRRFDLSKFPIADLLWSTSAGMRSGQLIVTDGATERRVAFSEGRVAGGTSSLPGDSLVRFLPERADLTEEEREQIATLGREGSHPGLADGIAATGPLTREELGRCLARQVKAIVLSLFPACHGTAFFSESGHRIPDDQMVGVSLHRLLYVGIRSMKRPDLVLVGLGDLDREVCLAETPPFRFILRKCPPGELEILERVQNRTTLRELVTLPDRSISPARAKAVYALCSSGVIEDVTESGHAPLQPVPHTETNGFLTTASACGPPSEETIREEVDRELLFTSRLDVAAWVRISSRREVVRALRRKLRRNLGFAELVRSGSRLETRIETLIGRLSTRLARLETTNEKLDLDAVPTIPTQTRAALADRALVGAGPSSRGGEAGPARAETGRDES